MKLDADTRKLVDEAMARDDKDITIFIGETSAHITISPREKHFPHWIEEERNGRHIGRFVCSECGCRNDYIAPFCPMCGEKLARPNRKEAKG